MGANTLNDDLREVDAIYGGIQSDVSITTGYDLDIESGATFSIDGTAVTATAAELNAVTGTSASAAELSTKYLWCTIADISGANAGYAVSPVAGTLNLVYSVIDGAITVGDAVITVNVNGGTDVTQTLTIATAASAAGDVDSVVPLDNNVVAVGDYISVTSDGGSTDACKAVFCFAITL